jgi:hypothetical protein
MRRRAASMRNWNMYSINSLNNIRRFFSVEFNDKVGNEDIFKPTICNKSLYEIVNDNEVTVANFIYL